MAMNDELMDAIKMRRNKDLQNRMSLSDSMADDVGPDSPGPNDYEAKMPQSPDQQYAHDPMKETGDGYLTEDAPPRFSAEGGEKKQDLSMSDGKDMDDSSQNVPGGKDGDVFAKALGTEAKGGLRGRAMEMFKQRGSKNTKEMGNG